MKKLKIHTFSLIPPPKKISALQVCMIVDINSISFNSSIGDLLPTPAPLDSHHPGPHLMRSFASSEGSFLGWLKSKIPALILKNGRHTFFKAKGVLELETLQVFVKKDHQHMAKHIQTTMN